MCSVPGCERRPKVKSLCKRCYYRIRNAERYAKDPAYRKKVLEYNRRKRQERGPGQEREKYHTDSEFRARKNLAAKRSYEKHKAARCLEQQERYHSNDDYRAAVQERARKVAPFRKDYVKQWCLENLERKTAADVRWRAANVTKVRVNKANYRARRKNAPGYFTDEEWLDRCNEYEGVCPRCCRPCETFTIDHIVPLTKGGTNWAWNLQPLCAPCNSSKNDGDPVYYPPPCHSL